jgi:drug/metabolite transporter (DMT)-like permease
MGILLGLLTALSWGCSDFIARFSARRIGALRTALYMQLTGFLLLTIFLRWIGGWGHLLDGSGWQPWGWGALVGLLNGIATLALYRSFELGKMAVVAPISSSYPALTMVLSWMSGERLTLLRLAGIAFALAGIVVVVRGETAPPEGEGASPIPPGKKASTGIGWACLAALGFGILFWLLGARVVPRVGFASTVWMIRLTSVVLTAVAILALRQPLGFPRRGPVSGWILGMGVLDTGAFVLNNLGMQLEQISIVSVLASVYSAVTVVLATIFLHERLSVTQVFGIVSIFAGVALISR